MTLKVVARPPLAPELRPIFSGFHENTCDRAGGADHLRRAAGGRRIQMHDESCGTEKWRNRLPSRDVRKAFLT